MSLNLDDTAVAVIGMACRFPGANDVDTFFENLLAGKESISRFTRQELEQAGVPPALAAHPEYVGAAGVLDEPYAFDAALFGISPAEAELIDPQHRWLLQCAWQALESAGYAPGKIRAPVGVYAGCSASSHRAPSLSGEDGVSVDALRALVANDKDYLATRLSYLLDLRGPSISVQTACSTSLVAVHLAAQSLLSGECELALAGGATISLPQQVGYLYQEGMILAPDGHCRAFDESASGVVGGNGVGIVVLKRLADALRDRDPIRAVLRGSAVSNDGADKLAFTAPSARGQARAIAEALGAAGLSADEIGYVEGHGTGTALGDPIEVRALTQVYRRQSQRVGYCALGSVKNNIGHLDAAAGIASFIKACLIAERGLLPPTLHFRRPHARLELESSPFYVPTSAQTWKDDGLPRRIGVSSFGFGGTNAHAVVEQPPPPTPRAEGAQRAPHLLLLSSAGSDSLRALAQRYLDHLERAPESSLADVCHTSQVARRQLSRRHAVVGLDRREVVAGLRALTAAESFAADSLRESAVAKPVFLFTGQGSQYVGMARALYDTEPAFRGAFDRNAEQLRPVFDLRRAVFDGDPACSLEETRYQQPCLFAIADGLLSLWRSYGVTPAAVLGHSVGELFAAYAAGVYTREAALFLVMKRAELTGSAREPGAMVAVLGSRPQVESVLREAAGKLSIAAVNGDTRIVISGERAAVERALERLSALALPWRRLPISQAFHSPLMQAAVDPMLHALRATSMSPLAVPLFANRAGRCFTAGDSVPAEMFAEQLVEPVEFAAALRAAHAQGHRLFLELGPDATLSRFGADILPDSTFIASLAGRESSGEGIERALASLFMAGVELDLSRRRDDPTLRRLPAPTYAFEQTRHGEPRATGRDSLSRMPKQQEPSLHETMLEAGRAQTEAGLSGLSLSAHREEEGALDQLAETFFRRAFTKLGLWTRGFSDTRAEAQRAGILSGYEGLLEAVAAQLRERGALERDTQGHYGRLRELGPETVRKAEQQAERAFSRMPSLRDIVLRPGRALAEVLRGQREPRELMFPEGALESAYEIYAELPTSRYFNGIVREVVRAAVEARGQQVRILELGAGTGATAEQILPWLDPTRARYVFSDVSPVFLDRARSRFSAFAHVEYRLLDVAQPASLQGYTPHEFDLVIAANVVHATANLRAAMQNVRNLLAPGGTLVLYEIVENSLLGDLTTTLLMPPVHATDPRRGRTFLAQSGWQTLLGESGFVRQSCLPERDSPAAIVGERVLIAHAPGQPRQRQLPAMSPAPAPVAVSSRDELFHQVRWLPLTTAPDAATDVTQSDWLVCLDRGGLGAELVSSLRAAGASVRVLSYESAPLLEALGADCRLLDAADPARFHTALEELSSRPVLQRRVLYLCGLDTEASADHGQTRACLDLFALIEALEASSWSALAELRVVTQQAETCAGAALELAAVPLLGTARVSALGHAQLQIRTLDFDRACTTAQRVAWLTRSLPEERVALRAGEVLVARLERVENGLLAAWPAGLRCAPDRSYLITGGRGGLGLRAAAWLAERGARRIVLLGRSAPGPEAERAALRLRERGVDVELARGDVAELEQVHALVARSQALGKPMAGVLHAAMQADSAALPDTHFEAVLRPKVTGVQVLAAATVDCALEFFVLFSSAVTMVPAHGLPAYVAANAYLDAFAVQQRARGQNTLSVSLGALSEVGTVAGASVAAQLARGGLLALPPAEAFHALERALASSSAHLGIFDADWGRLLGSFGAQTPAFYDRVADELPAADRLLVTGASLRALDPALRREALRSYLRSRLAETLRRPEAEITPQRHLMELGLDSLMFLGVSAQLSRELGIRVSPAQALRDFTLEGITGQLDTTLASGAPEVEVEDLTVFFEADPAARHLPFPLNDVQQAYYLGRSPDMVLGGVACHGYLEIDCRALDVARLSRAFDQVVQRHDMLRAVVDGDGMLRVLEDVPPHRFVTVDLRRDTPAARSEALGALRTTLAHRVPDPTRWPLCEVRLTYVDDETTRIHISLDNLVLDGRSTGIVLREWAALYAAPERTLPALTISSRDYTLAQRAYEQSPAFARSFAYWEARLAELPIGPELPLQKQPAQIDEPRFTRRGLVLDEARWSRLQALAAARGLTASGVLLAAYAEVLARYAQSGRFLLAVPSFQRTAFHPDVQQLVGEFTTIVPLVVDMASGPDFVARAQALQGQLLRDLENGPVSGVRVLRELRRTRSEPLLTPVVFTSVFGLEHEVDTRYWDDASQVEALGESVYTLSQTPQVLLDHHVHTKDGQLEAYWDAVEEAFGAPMLDSMFRCYERLLHRLCESEECWTSACIVELDERELEARAAANATQIDRRPELLQSGFRRACRAHPNREALVSGSLRLTYAQLAAGVQALALRLRAAGVSRGTLVGVVMERGWEQVVAVLAVLEAGGAYVPIDAQLPMRRITQLLQESGCLHVVTQARVDARIAWPAEVTRVSVAHEEASRSDRADVPTGTDSEPGDVAYVIYTSGSTGQPKGVVVSHAAAMNTIADMQQRFGVCMSDRLLGLSSLSFDLSVFDLFGVLGVGGCLVQVEQGHEKDAAHWATLIERERVSLWNSVPALLQMLVDELEASRRTLAPPRTALLSGDWIPLALAERTLTRWPQCELVSLGGATEAAIWSIYQRIPSGGFGGDWSSVPYGRPLANQRWHVLNERGETCPDGVPGELYIAGDGLAEGYHRDAARTAERFLLNTLTGERLYRTGDWGRYRAGGVLEFLGRKDSQVKVGGHRVELGEVEAAMASHPDVSEAVVHARGDARSASKKLVGYVVLHPHSEVSPQQLRAHAAERLPEYMVPRVVMVLLALPLSTNGKVDRQALPDPEPTRSADAHAEATTPQQEALLELCRELLSRDHVSLGDQFFALGGDSLIAARLSAALRTRFALRLSLRTIFAEPRLEHLADLIEMDEPMNETLSRQSEAYPEEDFDEGEVALPHSFLERLTARDVKLWSEQGRLRYRAPRGVLSDADKADIAARASELLRALGKDVSADTPAESAAVRTFPLSDSQQRFWFFEQLAGSQSAYNIPFTLSLRGDLQVERLRRALSALVQRHDSLRARFVRGSAEPVQVIDAPRPVTLEVRDFTERPLLERRLALRAWIEQQAALPFALEQGGLMRASLAIQERPNLQGSGCYVLLLSFHHAVADGWSLGVLWAELCELYRAEVEARPAELPPLRMRYVDHVQRERREATLPRREQGLSYWQQTLAGAPVLLELPSDRPRPSVRSLRGATVPWSLPSELVDQLQTFARTRAGTPYMVLLTAFAALLARISAQADLVIGTPAANRESSDVAGLVGVFVNTLALRLRLPTETSFEDAFGQARDVSLDALAHQNVPFERVVEALAPPRSMTHTPIFQVMFAYQSTPAQKPELPRVGSAPYMLPRQVSLFDLTLHAEESEGAVRGLLEYASDIFDASTAEQVATSFVALLRQCLADPSRPLHTHRLPGEEQTGVGTHLEGPTLSLAGQDLVLQRIARIAREHSDRSALRWTGGELPYGELLSLVVFTCGALREQGVQRGDVVAVALARGPEWVIAQLAILRLGAVYLPVDPKLPMQRQRYLLEDASARLVVCAEAALGFYRETGLPVHALATLAVLKAQREAGQPVRDVPVAVRGADPAYIIYTSGSSGAPKGVAIRHESLLNLVLACEQPCRLDGESQVLQAASVAFDASIWEVYATLAHGGCLCIPSDDERMPGPDLRGFLARHRISHALLTPSVLALIQESDLAHCTTLLVGGEACPLALAQRWARGRRLLNAYGPTECAVITTLGVVAPEASALSLGTPIANVSICILDAQRRPVPRGVAGELWIGGQGVAQGYLERPELTRERFVTLEQGASEGTLMYRSGDRGRLRADGTLEYLGRLDRQIKLRGLRIELGEIESALHALPGVRGAAVLVQESPWGERRLVGHVAHDDGQAAEPELRARLSRVLPSYMVPGELVIARTLPTTARGKLDMAALAAHVEPASAQETRPSASREQQVLDIFRELLARPGLTATQDFFASGGHSLLAVRLVQRLREQLGLEVPLRTLFSHPTVERLLGALASETATHDELLWLARGGRGRTIVCVDPPGEPGQRYAALGQALAEQADVALLRLGGVEEQLDIAALADRCARVLAREPITHVSALVGWSFGAALAFELGQRLQRTQPDAPTLCLLDGLEAAEARRLAELRLGAPAVSIEADALPDRAEDPSWQQEGRSRYAAKLRALTRYQASLYRGNAIVVAAQGADPTVPSDRGWSVAVQDGLHVLAADCLHDDVPSDPQVLHALAEALATRSNDHV